MLAVGRLCVGPLQEPLAGVLVDGLEHREAGVAAALLLLPDEALVQERFGAFEGILDGADLLHRTQGAAAGEHCEAGEERPFAFFQQRVAPVYGATQRLLPLWQVTRAARQELEPVACQAL